VSSKKFFDPPHFEITHMRVVVVVLDSYLPNRFSTSTTTTNNNNNNE
jgi:hypothetical protein